MYKLLMIVGVFLLVFSSGVILKDWPDIPSVKLVSADDIDCELNEMSTKECPTYTADKCTRESWFLE